MPIPEGVRPYFIGALELAPELFPSLLPFEANDPAWDERPFADRFTLREMIAHVADWNPIYHQRLQLTLERDKPVLPDMDEGQIAIDNGYAALDPLESLRRFVKSRSELVAYVRSLPSAAWGRAAIREGLGELTIGEQIALIGAHDAYHMRQAMEYRHAAVAR